MVLSYEGLLVNYLLDILFFYWNDVLKYIWEKYCFVFLVDDWIWMYINCFLEYFLDFLFLILYLEI